MTVYCGVDLHTRQQLVKWCDTRDGEIKEQCLSHDSLDSVRGFYSRLTGEGAYFDTRIVYIAESGPAQARVKRAVEAGGTAADDRDVVNFGVVNGRGRCARGGRCVCLHRKVVP